MDLSQKPNGCVVKSGTSTAARQAAKCLQSWGWAVLRGAIGAEEADALRAASEGAEVELAARDAEAAGNRGPRRYSLGSASRTHHMVHLPEWARLIDSPNITEVLVEAFEGDYVAIGGGGDLVLGETDSVQWLHVDLPRWEMYNELAPPPGIGVNIAVHAVTCEGGPMRLVPGTHAMPFRLELMSPQGESAMLMSLGLERVLVCPLHAGDAVLRDLRVWHAGSANLGSQTRHFPNVEFLASWYANVTEGTGDHLSPRPALPEELWETLTPHGKQISSRAVVVRGMPLDFGWLDHIAMPQQYD